MYCQNRKRYRPDKVFRRRKQFGIRLRLHTCGALGNQCTRDKSAITTHTPHVSVHHLLCLISSIYSSSVRQLAAAMTLNVTSSYMSVCYIKVRENVLMLDQNSEP